MKIIAEVGIGRIREKSKRQTSQLIAMAEQHGWRVNSPRNPEQRGGTVSIEMPDAEQVCRELLNRDILVDYRPKAGVRMAPHFYTKDEELTTAIAAVEEILKERAVAVKWKQHSNVRRGASRPAARDPKLGWVHRSGDQLPAPAFSPPARRSLELLHIK